ncbi:MAG: tripartite tricarboxylate transporter TctB family protein [Ottowia sp.]|uniref:tripartite tricarboxylate transporter TctB family protein n=1 Tax=Ottowia sp. TaxID=1898956 RepID=UPI0039E6C2EA
MNNRNLLRGLFLVAISLVFAGASLRYPVGGFDRAGPGLFPLMVSGMLLVIGVATLIQSRLLPPEPMKPQIKNISLILVALCGFALLSHFVNMIVGIVFMVFCASLAGDSFSAWRSAKIAAALVLIAVGFEKLLGLNLPLY